MKRPECGTLAGVAAHNRVVEVQCDECIEVKTNYQRTLRRRAMLGLPHRPRGGSLSGGLPYENDRPLWTRREDLADMSAVGPVLDLAWRWSA